MAVLTLIKKTCGCHSTESNLPGVEIFTVKSKVEWKMPKLILSVARITEYILNRVHLNLYFLCREERNFSKNKVKKSYDCFQRKKN